MTRQALISRGPGETRLAIAEDGVLTEFRIERDIAPSIVGRLFEARVATVAKPLGGVFVELGGGGEAFMETRKGAAPSEGERLRVRGVADAWGGKLPRVAADTADTAKDRSNETGPVARFLIEYAPDGLGSIRFDAPGLRPEMQAARTEAPELAGVELIYDDGSAGPLFETAGVAEEIARLAETSVPLPGGAVLHIETVRAATLIDLDTAKTPLRGAKSPAMEAVNASAVPEIVRQIRLRNIGGMILADFAGDTTGAAGRKAMAALEAAAEDDPQGLRVLGVSRLGLVEMTRRRPRRPLHDLWFGGEPTRTPTAATAALGLLRALADAFRRGGGRVPVARAGGAVHARLMAADMAPARAELETLAGGPVAISLDESLGMTDFAVD